MRRPDDLKETGSEENTEKAAIDAGADEQRRSNLWAALCVLLAIVAVSVAMGLVWLSELSSQANQDEIPAYSTSTCELGEFSPGSYVELTGHGWHRGWSTVQVLVRDEKNPDQWRTRSIPARLVRFVYDNELAGTMDETIATTTIHSMFGEQEASELVKATICLPESAKDEIEDAEKDGKGE